jgi:hypothetical protein
LRRPVLGAGQLSVLRRGPEREGRGLALRLNTRLRFDTADMWSVLERKVTKRHQAS